MSTMPMSVGAAVEDKTPDRCDDEKKTKKKPSAVILTREETTVVTENGVVKQQICSGKLIFGSAWVNKMADSVFPTQATAQTRYISLFGTRTRFVLMVLILLCLTSIWSNILAFNFAVICMNAGDNSTANTGNLEDGFTNFQKSWAMSIVAIAALIGNFPVVQLVGLVGIRTVFTGLGILSAVSTLLVPVSIRMGFYYFLAIRALQGFAFAANFPVIGSFCAKWSYFKQSGLFVSALVAYVQLAPAITMPASGALCDAFQWPSVFYAHGAVSLILFVTYGLFYRNSPQKHPFVGNVELKKISIGKIANVDKRALKKIPYGPILKTPAIWAVWIAAIGNFTCVNMMFLFSPTYLSQVLGFPVHSTGLSSAIPPLLQFLAKLIVGAISDRIHFISEATKFRIFNSVAFFGSAVFLTVLAFMGDSRKDLNMVVLGISAGLLGATTGGFFKAGPILSKQYSHFVTGNVSLGITITMLIVPFVVNALTHNNTQEEWSWVFLITAAVMVVTNLIFCVFVRGEPCEWTSDDFHRPGSVMDLQNERVKELDVEKVEQRL
ncbi:unnamed protein product [Caenorhabditis bovis]|uniref:Major facilitator superfamily (MFS) profile domain-containing protein n=1 Tax=Caenorhabditis bovis TaxID=2654633 RepID=A0A8S1ESN9_9PELO|nr:unnamed protein product [Caenorhabditis bovis]